MQCTCSYIRVSSMIWSLLLACPKLTYHYFYFHAHCGWTPSGAGSGRSDLAVDWLQRRGNQAVYLRLVPLHRGQAEVSPRVGELQDSGEASEGKGLGCSGALTRRFLTFFPTIPNCGNTDVTWVYDWLEHRRWEQLPLNSGFGNGVISTRQKFFSGGVNLYWLPANNSTTSLIWQT